MQENLPGMLNFCCDFIPDYLWLHSKPLLVERRYAGLVIERLWRNLYSSIATPEEFNQSFRGYTNYCISLFVVICIVYSEIF